MRSEEKRMMVVYPAHALLRSGPRVYNGTMNDTRAWYAALEKPFFAPPDWVFGPAWSILYLIIAVTFSFVGYRVATRAWPVVTIVPFALNLVFNLAFSPIQFGLRSNLLASLDILLVLFTILWFMRAVWPLARWVALLNIPYLLWVSFATVLQLSITVLNWS